MATFTLTKTPLTDDIAPSGAGYAGRTFTVPAALDDGTARPSGGLYLRAEVKTAGGVSVSDGVLVVSLWLKIGGAGGTWTQIGDPQTIPRGRRIVLPFGDLDVDAPGAVQITSVTGTGAASVDLTCEVGVAPPAQVGITGLPKMEPVGLYTAAPPVLAEADVTPFLVDSAGNLKVAMAGGGGAPSFPAAAALSDTTANPTTTTVGAMGMVWDVVGAVWRRMAAYNVANDALTDPALAVPIVGSFLVAWDNANTKWRRLKTDSGGSLKTRNLDSNALPSFPDGATPADASAYGTLSKIVSKLVASNGTTDDMVRAGLTAVQSVFTGMLNTLPFAKYNVTRPTLADTYGVGLQINQRGDLSVTEQQAPDYEDNANDVAWTQERAVADISALAGPWSNYSSGTTLIGNLGLVIKNTSGRLRAIGGANKHATSIFYLLVVDKATAPVANDPAIWSIPLAPGVAATFGASNQTLQFPGGLKCSNGIAFAISTDPQKVTLGTADCVVFAQYL